MGVTSPIRCAPFAIQAAGAHAVSQPPAPAVRLLPVITDNRGNHDLVPIAELHVRNRRGSRPISPSCQGCRAKSLIRRRPPLWLRITSMFKSWIAARDREVTHRRDIAEAL